MSFPEESLHNLLSYDGKVYVLTSGHWLKFNVRQVERSASVPHGIAYSFTLHGPSSERLLGFDNAHRVPRSGGSYVAAPLMRRITGIGTSTMVGDRTDLLTRTR